MAHGVMFHHFHDGVHPRAQGAMSADDLVELIDFIGRDRILSAQEWMDRALSGAIDDDKICLTFDDALLCQFDIAAPILDELGLTGFWFVYSSVFEGRIEKLEVYRYFRNNNYDSVDEFYADFHQHAKELYGELIEEKEREFDADTYLANYAVYSLNDRYFRFVRDEILGPERYEQVMDETIRRHKFNVENAAKHLWMTDEHLQTLEATGHMIGLHSYTHPTRLERMAVDEQIDEYGRNFRHLTTVLQNPPVVMSHPCNSYNDDTLGLLRQLGVKLGFRANMDKAPAASALEFPREDHAKIMREMRA